MIALPLKNTGFTLVEVMVALVIIAIAIVTLLSTHTASTRNYACSKATAISTMLAQKKLAELQIAELPEEGGEDSGVFEDNENYQWSLILKETDIEQLFELNLQVSLAPDEDIAGDIDEMPVIGQVSVITYLTKLSEEEEEEEGTSE